MLKRYYDNLGKLIQPGKALIIYGPRRVGKTTLLKQFLKKTKLKYRLDSGDNIRIQQTLSSQDFKLIKEYISGYDLIAIDEAQQIPNIGQSLKIIIDESSQTKIIATGSSSFDLAGQIGEPLTGRKKTLILYPIACLELKKKFNRFELKEKLEELLIFGSYPEVITAKTREEKVDFLNEIVDSYLLKDILNFDRVRGAKIVLNLLRLLAFQLGHEVSLNELSQELSIDVKTVGRYLDILEKAFVVVSLSGFSRNLRGEVTSKNKYYFLDLGIRNAIISQFNLLDLRDDIGALFENFIFIERLKKRAYKKISGNVYFWRTYDGQEIDFVEERGGKLYGYECKWSDERSVKAPKDWLKYNQAEFKVINRKNYLNFIL